MPTKTINGADLYYELLGEGVPLVLVHGSWIDATSWDLVVPAFADHYRVLTYDRRGHSRSHRRPAGSRGQDEDDLIALLETLDARTCPPRRQLVRRRDRAGRRRAATRPRAQRRGPRARAGRYCQRWQ